MFQWGKGVSHTRGHQRRLQTVPGTQSVTFFDCGKVCCTRLQQARRERDDESPEMQLSFRYFSALCSDVRVDVKNGDDLEAAGRGRGVRLYCGREDVEGGGGREEERGGGEGGGEGGVWRGGGWHHRAAKRRGWR